jgi:hypothetical protein
VFDLAQARAVRERVADIERAVRGGRLMPRAVLSVHEIADELGVRPSALARCLQRLDDDRLIDLVDPSTAVVTPVEARDLDEMFNLRATIEPALLDAAVTARSVPLGDVPTSEPAVLRPSRKPMADWRDDEIFAATTREFVTIARPASPELVMTIFNDLIAGTERSIRVGFGLLYDTSPHDLTELARLLDVAVHAYASGESGAIREACSATISMLRDIAWHGATASTIY